MTRSLLSPAEKLATSREHLRQALRAPRAAPADMGSGNGRLGGAAQGLAAALANGLNALPGGPVLSSLVMAALGPWWAQHPLRTTAAALGAAAKTLLQPLAKKHPLGLALGAMALGGVLAWSRPWRWVLKPALLVGLLPQVLAQLLNKVPPGAWLAMVAEFAKSQARAGAQDAAQAHKHKHKHKPTPNHKPKRSPGRPISPPRPGLNRRPTR